MSPFQDLKFWLIDHVGLEKDALHIYVALTLLFGSALLFRWSLRRWKPYVLILCFALLGEILDLRDGLASKVPLARSIPDSVHDIWNTMFWPLAILMLIRFTRIFERGEHD